MPNVILPSNVTYGRSRGGDVVDLDQNTINSLNAQGVYPELADVRKSKEANKAVPAAKVLHRGDETLWVTCPTMLKKSGVTPGQAMQITYAERAALCSSLSITVSEMPEVPEPTSSQEGAGKED